jgi:hypothetical protein
MTAILIVPPIFADAKTVAEVDAHGIGDYTWHLAFARSGTWTAD